MKPDVSIIPTRAPVPIIARKPLTRREAIYLAVKQHGLCGCGECDKLLDPLTEGVIDEHVLALRLGGTNDLTNRALWRLPCAKAKTKTAGHDSKQGSKLTRRVEDEKREAIAEAEARTKAAEAATKRVAKRAHAGLCQCCNRTFSNVAQHMADMHPEIAVLKIPKTKKPKKVSHA